MVRINMEFIKIKDKMPLPGEPVLCLLKYKAKTMEVLYWNHIGKYWGAIGKKGLMYKKQIVTQWMPLPELPKD